MNTKTLLRAAFTLAGGALLLAACGGGSSGGTSGGSPADTDPPFAGSEVPVSATTSSQGAFAFVKSVAASSDDTATPIVVGDVTLATSDTDDPDPGV